MKVNAMFRIAFDYCLAALCILTLGVGAMAQQSSMLPGVPVHMVVTVEARRGTQVPTINKDDVMVYQGKDRDQVTDWVPLQGDKAALDLYILLDDGSSFSLGSQLDDIRHFIEAQPATTRIGIAYMQNGVAQVVRDLTNDHAAAARALRLPMGSPGINGSPYFSLQDLIKRWPEGSARREVLMATDGVDRFYGPGSDDPYVSSAVEDAQRAGVIVYAIYTPGVGHLGHSYWSTYWGQIYLSQIAAETGGESYYIGFNGPPVAFAPYLDSVSAHLTNQHLLTFQAKPEKKAGMQRVRLATEVPNADLVGPHSIWVPAGQ